MISFPTKIKTRLSTRWIYSIILLIIFGISLALRVSVPYESVFTGDGVIFGANDPWYHMRLVENLVQHFPHRIAFDPFTLYPYGQVVPFAPFFDLLLGFVIWIIGFGSPTQYTIETVGAYFPAILGALVTIPVYFIGRELFNRNVGLLSAALIAILPGQFLFRSMLGFTDHHVAEVLFSTTAALFLILALKSAKEKETSFSHIKNREWDHLNKPLIYALLAGLALGIYFLSWIGALLFVLIILVYILIQYIIDHLRGKPTDYLCIIGVPMFLIVLIMVIPFSNSLIYWGQVISILVVAVLTLPVLSGVSRFMTHRTIKRAYYPLVLAVLGLVGIALIYIIEPSLYHAAVVRFRQVFFPSEIAQTIGEVRSLLSFFGLEYMIYHFTTGIIFAPIALGLLIYTEIKMRRGERTILFLVTWCLIILLAMLGQNRFAYYFAVNVALLSGYLCWKILEWSWIYFREALPERKKGKSKVTRESEPEAQSAATRYNILQRAAERVVWAFRFFIYDPKQAAMRITQPGESLTSEPKKAPRIPIRSHFRVWHAMAGVSIIVFIVAFIPNIGASIIEGKDLLRPDEAWYSSLLWMQENTPDPFENPDYYYDVYKRPSPGESYDYPDSAYGVMNFWDYGHWITRIAHRIPSSNPFQAGARKTSEFFVTENESHAKEILEEFESKYVIVDYMMATGKFQAMSVWGGGSELTYWEQYNRDPADGIQGPITLYYPEYYRSMCIRLYNFGGEAVVPHNSTYVIAYKEKRESLGAYYKEITTIQLFATYEEAQEFVESQTEPNYRIVGMEPFTSPVPLNELEDYQLVHQSDPELLTKKKVEPLPYVKIFEYIP